MEKTPDDDNRKGVEIMVPLRYLRNFWRTLEIPIINCEVNLISAWFRDCVITNSTGDGKFKINDAKLIYYYYLLRMMMVENHIKIIIFQK